MRRILVQTSMLDSPHAFAERTQCLEAPPKLLGNPKPEIPKRLDPNP